jgi:hypothetical protein
LRAWAIDSTPASPTLFPVVKVLINNDLINITSQDVREEARERERSERFT